MAYGDSTSDSLAAVRASIAEALQASSYSQRSRSWTAQRIDALFKLEERLMERAQQEGNGSMSTVGILSRPT